MNSCVSLMFKWIYSDPNNSLITDDGTLKEYSGGVTNPRTTSSSANRPVFVTLTRTIWRKKCFHHNYFSLMI
jgi:hypothetical protein